jgi:small subunit ribosomal protein S8
MMTDPIADMLTRFRNAAAIRKPEVVLPHSKMKYDIAKILEKEGFVGGVERIEAKPAPQLKVSLKYDKDGSAFQHVQRVSKPGRRIYAGKSDLPRVLNGIGISIVSTSAGMMTNKQARKRGLGGEIICEIY